MTMRRDNFSEKTRWQIARLAGGVCAYPGCQAVTFGATEDATKVLDIGIAAHICAASPGGPRYDSSMTSANRASSANGIWMCSDHGRAIDADPQHHTVALLRQWKREAEHAAFLRVTRQPVSAPPPIAFEDLYSAARAELVVLRAMPKWPKSSIALTLKIDGFDASMTTSGLAAAAVQLEDLILTAPPGMGKTTTLLQIAESVLDGGHAAPIFVSLGDWASDGRTILVTILARSNFAGINEARFREAASGTGIVLLLDGWNELDANARQRARVELERLQAQYPRLALIVSTRRQALDVPLKGKRVDLLPLSESQQEEIARAIAGDAGASLLDRAWRTPGIRELVNIPLYLTVLMSLGDAAFPATREELLRQFVIAHESEPRRAEVLAQEAKGFHQTFLTEIACVATHAANTAVQDSDARRAVSTAVTVLIDDGQMAVRLEPSAVLATLIDNTVLTLSAERSAVTFQHQQFQEWFASRDVEDRMLAWFDDRNAARDLQTGIFDRPAWEEPILFAVERLSRGDDRQRRACAAAILAAFPVDPMLAADMIYRATDDVWGAIERAIAMKIAAWHTPGEPDRALRFMMLSARPEFLDRVWPLISDVDKQASLRAMRVSRGLRPRLLGADAVARLKALPDEARRVMLGELAMDGDPEALDLATEVAETDPDPEVQRAVIDALSFRSAGRHLARLLKHVPDDVIDRAVSRGLDLPFGDEPAMQARLDAARRRIERHADPLYELRSVAFGYRADPGADKLRKLILAVDLKDRQDPATSLIFQAQSLYPVAVAEALVDRVLGNKRVFYRAGDLIAPLDLGREDPALVKIVLEDGERSDRAETAASALGPVATGTLIDAIMALNRDRAETYNKETADRERALQTRLEQVPGRSLVAAIEQRAENAETSTLAQYARMLSRHPQDGDDRARLFDPESLERVRGLAARWGELFLADPDTSRADLGRVATLIQHVADARFIDLLPRLLEENLRRLAAFRADAEAQQWRPSQALQEMRSPMTEHYARAFKAIDDPATRDLMRTYLDDPEFGEQAARILCGHWIDKHRQQPARRFGGSVDYSSVAERRAELRSDPSAVTADAAAILAVAERLMAGSADDATVNRAVTLATIAARMPHGGHDATFRTMIERSALAVRPRLLLMMGLSGDELVSDTVAQGIVATFAAAEKEPWILIDSNAWRLRDWLMLLPFLDDLSRVVPIIRDIPEQHRRDDRLEVVIDGLVNIPSPGAEQLLFDLADLQPTLLQNHAWSDAVLKLGATGLDKLVGLIAAGHAIGRRSPNEWAWARQLGERLAEHPNVKREALRYLKGSDQTPGLALLAIALAQLPDMESLEVLIELEQRWKKSLVDYRSLQAMVTDQVLAPEWNNAYTIVPKAAPDLRHRLLHLTTDGSKEDRASVMLTRIDWIRDEYGLALEEPRHPDFASGKTWPMLVRTDEAAVD